MTEARPLYKDLIKPVEERVEDLLKRMTLEEKVGQMCQYSVHPGAVKEFTHLLEKGLVGSFLNLLGAENVNEVQRIAVEKSRLGIPLLMGFDVIHGYKTIFPIPLAMASSWDPEVVKKACEVAAREASADGVKWTFAPMLDIARDPRWGRIAEGFGEDPYLASVMAWAAVKGFQGEELSPNPDKIAACAKHYVAYGGAEGGRDYNTVDISERTLREIYMQPFKSAVAAGVATVMSAFNDLCGIPASANEFTIRKVLKGEWGFQGFVVSDWNSVGELIVHGIARDGAEAARLGVTSGVDMDMVGDVYRRYLVELVRKGVVPEKLVDDAVRRILTVKFKLGLFENPYADPEKAKKVIKCREHLDAALEVARKCIVLVKNEGVLPFKKSLKRVAVIGPLADDKESMLGCWRGFGDPADSVTVLEGVRKKLGSEAKVLYAKGCDVKSQDRSGFEEAVRVAADADAVILVVGESWDMSGEAASRAYLDLPGVQEELVKTVYEAAAGRKIPVVMVVMSGRPLTIKRPAEYVPAILVAWHLGVRAGDAVADVVFGDFNPGGKLPVTWPKTVGQVPIYYNHKMTGRPPSSERFTSKYIDEDWRPLFPFGHGLSYTSFEYSDLNVKPEVVEPGSVVQISFTLTNTGGVEGDEVAQLYVRDVSASVTRPVKELKGFKRVTLKPGEKKRIVFNLPTELLAFYDREMNYFVEAGDYEVMIGSSSEDIRLKGRFTITRSEKVTDLRKVWFTETQVY
ncbi:MAG: beta-glucosidase BglX [Thermofilaceae archaeon]|nr:beta-glucosidase BglX [Thermofilaceae archaeon]MCX8179855.1 beta-glucosidase BglX [Thermofilaceae archaeon]MDW8004460.1 beta-glucosidase BglX [Thermofilaceae archaeon]